MTFLAGLLFLLVATVIGCAMLPARTVLARSAAEEAALSYLLGAAAVVVGLTAGLAAGIRFDLLFFLPLLAAAGCAFVLWRRGPGGALAPWELGRPAAVVLGLLALGSVAATLALPLNEFDPIYHFAYRGRVLLHDGIANGESIVGMIQADGYGRLVTHPNYPFGVPILEAWTATIGGWDDRWVQLPLAFWTACLPMAVAFGLRDRGSSAARTGALVAAVTPMLYGADYLMRGFVDLPRAGLAGEMMLGGGGDLAVATFMTLGFALWLRVRATASWHGIALAALAFAAAAMMKNEGLALGGCVVLALLLGELLPRFRAEFPRLLAPFRLAALLVLMVLPWVLLRAQLPAIDENYTERLTPANVAHFWTADELVDRSPQAQAGKTDDSGPVEKRRAVVVAAFLEEFMDWRSWGLLWLLFLFSLPVTRARLADPRLKQLCLLVLGATLLYFLILLVTPWNFPSLRDKGIPERLLVHLTGVMALAVGSALGIGRADGPDSATATEQAATEVAA